MSNDFSLNIPSIVGVIEVVPINIRATGCWCHRRRRRAGSLGLLRICLGDFFSGSYTLLLATLGTLATCRVSQQATDLLFGI